MKTSALRTLLMHFVIPALLGFLVFVVACVAAEWPCHVSGCTHWLKKALMLPNTCAFDLLAKTLGYTMGEALLGIAFPAILIMWPVLGILLAAAVRKLVHLRDPHSCQTHQATAPDS